MGKRNYRIEKLPDDLIEIYSGFSGGFIPDDGKERVCRRWPCSNKECNRVVTHLCVFTYKTKKGKAITSKRHSCHEHAMAFSINFKTALPLNYIGPERPNREPIKQLSVVQKIQLGLSEIGIKLYGSDLPNDKKEEAAKIILKHISNLLKVATFAILQ